MKKEMQMTLNKETKRTVVYVSANENDAITSVYIKKVSLPTPFPATITLTIEV